MASLNLYKYHTKPEQLIGGNTPYLYVPELAFSYLVYDNPDDELRHKLESIISTDALKSLHYAQHIGKAFPLGEKTISKDPEMSYQYARLVGPFKLGEPAIATNALTSFYYAKNILKNRFVAGEKRLKKTGWIDDYNDFLESIGRPRIK